MSRVDAFAAVGFTIVLLLFMVCISILAHCSDTTKQCMLPEGCNSLGVVISNVDPNVSLVGSIVSGEMHQDKDGRVGTSVRVHPKAMYALWDESILFCGDESERLSTPDGNLLIGNYAFTYRRAASRLIDGVACHELVAVDKIVEDK